MRMSFIWSTRYNNSVYLLPVNTVYIWYSICYQVTLYMALYLLPGNTYCSICYQVTPINALYDNLDWVRYLNIWESLSSDLQRVGELVGVSERFITLSHQGRRRRNNDNQRRSLQIHKRFYTALILHDLVNEVRD